ncbi:MAG: hypothetical protein JW779_11230 [Candidatus Thorarchaeota archaeon]|nr:hypothetical protein [Candidatus Thorarchaeota archaeon]
MSMREREIDRIIRMYQMYLNGPLGKRVMENLEDGESFTLKAHNEVFHISKIDGKAVVRVIRGEVAEQTSSIMNHEEISNRFP